MSDVEQSAASPQREQSGRQAAAIARRVQRLLGRRSRRYPELEPDPLVVAYANSRYGNAATQGGTVPFGASLAAQFSRESVPSAFSRCYAAFLALDGVEAAAFRSARAAMAAHTTGWGEFTLAIFADLSDGYRLRFDRDSEPIAVQAITPELLHKLAHQDGNLGATLVGPHGVSFGHVGAPSAEEPVTACSCSVCLRMLGGSLVTVIERTMSFTPQFDQVPAMDDLTANDVDLFDTRLALLMDPRAWELATGAQTGGGAGTISGGWLCSRPNRSPLADPPQVRWYDSVSGNYPDDVGEPQDWRDNGANQDPAVSWSTQNFYELVWPGFNDPFGVILGIEYRSEMAAKNEIRVNYWLNEQLVHDYGGVVGRLPVGPNVMPLVRDDGYFTVRKDASVSPAAPTYTVTLYKELDFEDIRPGRVFDGIEEAIPFLACAWFDSVQMQWAHVLLGDPQNPGRWLDNAALRRAIVDLQKNKPHYPPQP